MAKRTKSAEMALCTSTVSEISLKQFVNMDKGRERFSLKGIQNELFLGH
jgi:hypothetical protein